MKRHKKGEPTDSHDRGHHHRHHKSDRRKEAIDEKYVSTRKRSPQSSSSSVVREDVGGKKRKRKSSSYSSSSSFESPASRHKMKKQRYKSPSPKGKTKPKKDHERGRSREKKSRKSKDNEKIHESHDLHRSQSSASSKNVYHESHEQHKYKDDRSRSGKPTNEPKQKAISKVAHSDSVKKSQWRQESEYESSTDEWSSGKKPEKKHKEEKTHKKHKKEVIQDPPREKQKKKSKEQEVERTLKSRQPLKHEIDERTSSSRDGRRHEEDYDRTHARESKEKYERYEDDSCSDGGGKKKNKLKKRKKQKIEEEKPRNVSRKRSRQRSEERSPEMTKSKKVKKHHHHDEDYTSGSEMESTGSRRKDVRVARVDAEWKTVDDIADNHQQHHKSERSYSSQKTRSYPEVQHPREDRPPRYEAAKHPSQERIDYPPHPKARMERTPEQRVERAPDRRERSPERRREPTPEVRRERSPKHRRDQTPEMRRERSLERRPDDRQKFKMREDKSVERRRHEEEFYKPRDAERSSEYPRPRDRKVEKYEIREKIPPSGRYDERKSDRKFDGSQERIPEKIRESPRFYEKQAAPRYPDKQFEGRDMRFNDRRYEDVGRSRRQDFPPEGVQRTQKIIKVDREVLVRDHRGREEVRAKERKILDPRGGRSDFPPQRTASWDSDRERKMRPRSSQDYEEPQRISSWVDGRDGAKLRIEARDSFGREKWTPEVSRHRVEDRKVEVDFGRGRPERSVPRERGQFPSDRTPPPASRFTREVRQSGEPRSRDLGLEVTIHDGGGRSSITHESSSKSRASPPRHVSYDSSRGKRMYDSSKERASHPNIHRERSNSETRRPDKQGRRDDYSSSHAHLRAHESTRQSVNELIDRTRHHSRSIDTKSQPSPSSHKDDVNKSKRSIHEREHSSASRSPRRSRHGHHSSHNSNDREKLERKSSRTKSSRDSRRSGSEARGKSKEEKKSESKGEKVKPSKAADVLEVDWPSLSPDKEINEPEPDSILNRFTPGNVLLNMGVSTKLLPAHLLEKVSNLCGKNNNISDSRPLVTTHGLGALNRNESLRHTAWHSVFKARPSRVTTYDDLKFRVRVLHRTEFPPPPTTPPTIINTKSYAASIKHFVSKIKPLEVQ
uniref:Serine/arginine repetitive matrix protein 1-like n=1 Tax=Ciona intestinalis TaxID=7719 RepID=A0A1W5B6S5_CIOIN|nr:serine/arginine repetitive matrix protein 1-like isoform X2 [Ciona intestinalis]|eukprot:XP_002119653.2 serine/arginine repetitive matrix protein 1-like isoform X2 [Ciona intestinalis]